mgnify:CR=1 FL=1
MEWFYRPVRTERGWLMEGDDPAGGLGDDGRYGFAGRFAPAESGWLDAQQRAVGGQAVEQRRDGHQIREPDFVHAAFSVADKGIHVGPHQ